MRFLTETFTCLKHLAVVIPAEEPLHPVAKSQVVPMKILFKDEKYKSATIEILTQLLDDASLSGDPVSNNYNKRGTKSAYKMTVDFIAGSCG